MYKKLTSVILAALMLLSLVPCAADTSSAYSDSAQRALEVMSALKLMTPTMEDLSGESEAIKRSEFATVAVRMLGMEEPPQTETGFGDVPAEHWASGWIAAAQGLGVMEGDENGLFQPDAPVTYEQVLKVVVYLLGYSVQAEGIGGYPAGYVQMASRLDLNTGLERGVGDPLTRADTAIILYNSFDVELQQQILFGDKRGFRAQEGETILSEYMGITRGCGVLRECGDRSIVKNPVAQSQCMAVIDQEIFACDNAAELGEYLGYTVEYYAYQGKPGEKQKLFFLLPDQDNRELTVSARNILWNNDGFSLTRFVYQRENDERVRAMQIANRLCFVKNGKFDFDFDLEDFRMENGYVRLIDWDGDSTADVVFVWDFDNYVVESTAGARVTCKYGRVLNFEDLEEENFSLILPDGRRGGKELLEALLPWDVLSVAVSRDRELTTVFASRRGMAGTVDSVMDQDEVVIEGERHYLQPGLNQLLSQNGAAKIVPGVNGEFFVDVTGIIAAWQEMAARGEEYGYLLDVSASQVFIGGHSAVKLQMFTQTGELAVLETRDRVKDLKTNSRVWASDLLMSGADFRDGGAWKPQLVKFVRNEAGAVVSIGAATVTNGSEENLIPYYDLEHFSLDYQTEDKNFRYRRSSGLFGDADNAYRPGFRINQSTKVFYVPSYEGKILKDEMRIFDMDSFGDYVYQYKNLLFYDNNETGLCAAVVYQEQRDSLGKSSTAITQNDLFVVTHTVQRLDEEGDPVEALEGMISGTQQSMEYVNLTDQELIPGMVLAVAKDSYNRLVINESSVIYSPKGNQSFFEKQIIRGSDPQPEVWASYGVLCRKNGRYFTVRFGDSLPQPFYLADGFRVYVLDTEKGTVRIGGESDLLAADSGGTVVGSQVVMNSRYDYVREIILLESHR